MAMTFGDVSHQQLNSQAMGDIGRVGLLMAGLGMGWRGLEGLGSLYARNNRPQPRSLLHTDYVDMPVEDKQAGMFEDMVQPAVRPITQALKGNVSTHTALPWFLPAMLATGAGGAYGGYHLTDKLLDQRRKSDLESQMEQARNAYLQALQGGTKLGEALDQFCDTLEEKQAETEYFSPDSAGHGMGILASLLGLGAVGTGMWAYDATKKQLPSNMLEEAKQREARNRMIARPSPVYARLAPTGSSLLTRP